MYRLLLLLILLTGCGKKEPITHIRSAAMTIPFHIQLGETLRYHRAKKAQKIIKETFALIDKTMNHWNPDSELSGLNHLPLNTPVYITPHLAKVLLLAKEVHHLSDGKFDPTQGLTISKWKGALLSQEMPSDIPLPGGFDCLAITDTSFEKKRAVHIDLDGISKGYAVDLLLEKLGEAGFYNVYVNWGGEIRVRGHHPSGRPWQVLIGATGQVIPLEDQAIATSGNTCQAREIDGTVYSHYIDPETGRAYPQTASRNVTVVAPTCALADALATSAMLFPPGPAYDTWKRTITADNPAIRFY